MAVARRRRSAAESGPDKPSSGNVPAMSMNRLAIAAIAAACGGVSACLYLALLLSSPGAMILVYLTQLPLFLAGLWFGSVAAAIAGLSGVVVLLAASDLLGAAIFTALNAVPVVVLVRQALLARRDADGTLRWYPPGHLTVWVTALGILGIGAAILLLGGPEGLQATLRRLPHPGRALIAFYSLAGMFGWPLLAAMVLGLFEAWLGLRRRLAPHGVHIDG